MDYFKKLAGEEVTVEVGNVSAENLTEKLHEYTKIGYREFKLETADFRGQAYSVIARGDKATVRKQVAKWYPDLLDE